ncbi:hypothetical protein J2Y69_003069 [Microbacterium resistens]|uniref:HK97 gp10 family phage protein n=1 Tax=Microbacterium resistens TaxID=156977 RepID=A0ABU1SFT0_9MICO|nr:hypothetical protein [Microbacterium resistens]MDR6868453.1 hypothetical protein [Microbacterium resistens]
MSDLDALARDLTDLADLVPKRAEQAVQQAALRTRDNWRTKAAGNPLKRQYTATIDYTVGRESSAGVKEIAVGGAVRGTYYAEVGPDLDRYGGTTGKAGLVPSAGIFDDPISPVRRKPDRARRDAENFAENELSKGIEIALRDSLTDRGL